MKNTCSPVPPKAAPAEPATWVESANPATQEPVGRGTSADRLTAQIEPFDSFWEGPQDVEQGYRSFGRFYRVNYLKYLPAEKQARILVVSCGPGYFVKLLRDEGYENVLGIDSCAAKVAHAVRHGLNCRVARAFDALHRTDAPYDAIVCEQELNHLTKQEMIEFLELVRDKLASGGVLVCHGLNGANPVVGAETLAQNFDHYNTFTEYSLRQVLEHCGFRRVRTFGLHLYVFYFNPLNYVAWGAASLLNIAFRALFILYGKSNRTFTKKIGAVAFRC